MSNMSIYDALRNTPKEAQKTIKGGRLSGFTDINPQYRIEQLTKQFGPCGIGWYYEPVKKWTEQAGDELLCFVDINLFIKVDGEWSKPIAGTGGSSLLMSESRGLRASDEGYKMATTDAISVACKQLGIGADIYWAAGETKYSRQEEVKERPAVVTRAEPEDEVQRRVKSVNALLDEFGFLSSDYKHFSQAMGSKNPREMTVEEFDHHLKALRNYLADIKHQETA